MRLDGLTLMVAGCFVATLGGLLLVGAWTQMRGARALLWWAAAHVINSLAAAVLALGLATGLQSTALVGGGGVVASMILYWVGVRIFTNRPPAPWVAGATVVVWTLASLPVIPNEPRVSLAVAFLLTACLLCLAAFELWSTRAERLAARWPLIAVFALHAGFMAIGFVEIVFGNLVPDAAPVVGSWFGMVHFERLVFLMGGAVFMVAIARERSELMSAFAAGVDALTGISNRGSFFTDAERLYRRARADGAPISLIAFDLDHFKTVNDTYGHAAGDRVLRSFADAAAAVLRPGDLFGRIGGEEFAAILPGAGMEAAYVVAERVRHAFAGSPQTVGSAAIHATVSAGVATAGSRGALETLLEASDRALYRAKALGRNRVERGGDSWPAEAAGAVRVA